MVLAGLTAGCPHGAMQGVEGSENGASAHSAAQILERTEARYSQTSSYADTGTLTFTRSSGDPELIVDFMLLFERPRLLFVFGRRGHSVPCSGYAIYASSEERAETWTSAGRLGNESSLRSALAAATGL